jgi:hypothetical protein
LISHPVRRDGPSAGPAILHRHLIDDVPDIRLVRPTRALGAVTGNGVDARRSLDLVPTVTQEALWIAVPRIRGRLILT